MTTTSTLVCAVLLLSLIPLAASISCFVCGPGGNCNDPFSSTSSNLLSGVYVNSSCGGCTKTSSSSTVTRSCVSTCAGFSVSAFAFGSGAACCSDRDYCNGTLNLRHTPITLFYCLIMFVITRRIFFV